MLDVIQREAFSYFAHETNRANGLVFDTNSGVAPSSIAAIGLGLTAYPVAVERGFISRAEAVERTLTTLRFFWRSKQGPEPDATGYRGFYYHFLDMQTGARVWQCELSTVDSALLLAGMLTAAAYFDEDSRAEREIRDLADRLYARADWQWAQNGGATVTHGWTPESGFLPYRWEGYDEALLLYVLGSAPRRIRSPPRAIRPGPRRMNGEPSTTCISVRRAALHPSALASVDRLPRNPGRVHARSRNRLFREQPARHVSPAAVCHPESPRICPDYGEQCWGITASDGPGNLTREVAGVTRRFFGYCARGVPTAPTTARWLHGAWSRRCRLLRRCAANDRPYAARCGLAALIATASRRHSIPPFPIPVARHRAGFRPGTAVSIRGRSF